MKINLKDLKINLNDKKTVAVIVVVSLVVILLLCFILWKVADSKSINVNNDTELSTGESLEIEIPDADLVEEVEDKEELELEEEEVQIEQEPNLTEMSYEIDGNTLGIDVSEYQGNIDWSAVADAGIEFAMIRIGTRNSVTGVISEDACARYNLQEATAQGILVGVYFFSTAITEAEILEEVEFVCDIIDDYAITYPVVYDCESFTNSSSRQYDLSVSQRTELAMAFLEEVESRGYIGMFYGSSSDMEGNANWNTNTIELSYRIWVAKYDSDGNVSIDEEPSYSSEYAMWQYSDSGVVDGIDGSVDMNIAYFGCSQAAEPKSEEAAETVEADIEVGVSFQEVDQEVTAKEVVNVRSTMDQGDDSNIIGSISNGTVVTRTGIGNNGWSRITYNGETGYVVSQYITTDLSYTVTEEESEFNTVFTDVNEQVTAKEVVNLRDIPSVESPSQVVCELLNGEVATRTGISNEGWSRVEYNGQVLYCISSYLQVVE